jgi:cytochrome c
VIYMTKLRARWAIGPGICGVLLVVRSAGAQMPLPAAKPADGATLFRQQSLDAWLTNPQQIIPGAVMAYRQSKPETRAAIIAFLKELN